MVWQIQNDWILIQFKAIQFKTITFFPHVKHTEFHEVVYKIPLLHENLGMHNSNPSCKHSLESGKFSAWYNRC